MKSSRTRTSLRGYILLAIAAAVLAGWSWQEYQFVLSESGTALERLEMCRRQAEEIVQLRNQPSFAATTIADINSLTALISHARDLGKLEERAVERVEPHPPSRWRDSPYLLRPVAIQLRNLTLDQVARFVDGLTNLDAGMWVNHLRLTPLRREQSPGEKEAWNVELTLTQVVFSPKTP